MPLGTRSTRLVLIVAVLASIATSAPRWTLEFSTSLDELTLDNAEPTRAFAIQSTLSSRDGAVPRPDIAFVHLELRGRGVTGMRDAEVTVTFASDARPLESEHRVVNVAPGGLAFVDVSVPAWTDCAPRQCIEDYTLTLRRRALDEDPIVDVSARIRVVASGDGSETPPGALLEVDVTDLGPAP